MSEFRLTIRTDGAAFDPWPANEVAAILRELSDKLYEGQVVLSEPHVLMDGNGNTVGMTEFD